MEDGEKDKTAEYLAYLCDRVQKITKAIYRVTDIMSDEEPLKWEIRRRAVNVFTALTSLRNKDCFEQIAGFEKSKYFIEQVLAVCTLLSGDMSISSLNFEIIKEEYLVTKDLVVKEKKNNENLIKSVLTDNKGHLKLSKPELAKTNEVDKEKIENIGSKVLNTNGQTNGQIIRKKTNVQNNVRNEDRKKKIIDILKNKDKATAGELAGYFSGYSEKTIQRDLLELVAQGLLKKSGDKRWRVYYLDINELVDKEQKA
ncbi:MAG: DeoR family transcriptional regulator [bacterium]|nr:DeoR family transcriptional regulator [bacterium]